MTEPDGPAADWIDSYAEDADHNLAVSWKELSAGIDAALEGLRDAQNALDQMSGDIELATVDAQVAGDVEVYLVGTRRGLRALHAIVETNASDYLHKTADCRDKRHDRCDSCVHCGCKCHCHAAHQDHLDRTHGRCGCECHV